LNESAIQLSITISAFTKMSSHHILYITTMRNLLIYSYFEKENNYFEEFPSGNVIPTFPVHIHYPPNFCYKNQLLVLFEISNIVSRYLYLMINYHLVSTLMRI